MQLNARKILGVAVTTEKKEKILEEIQKGYSSPRDFRGKPLRKTPKMVTIVTPNPEIMMEAQRNMVFAGILNRADVALPDGIGLVLAAQILRLRTQQDSYGSLSGVIHGVDCMADLVSFAAKQRIPIGLIGGRKGVALKAFECLKKTHPGLTGWSMELPQMSLSDVQQAYTASLGLLQSAQARVSRAVSSVCTAMQERPVGMMFVALGAPKQEYFLELLTREWKQRAQRQGSTALSKQLVCMTVGGAFDMIAGITPRAPAIMRFLYLEWLWRLFLEPTRIGRQWNLVRFMGTVLFQPIYTL